MFQGVPNLDASIVGVRYDMSTNAALKVEYRALRRISGTPIVHGGFLQISFTF